MTYRIFTLLSLFVAFGLTTSCIRESCDATLHFVEYVPVFMQPEDLRTIAWEGSRDLQNPGKIYSYGNLLLINERHEGVHLIDNTDPSSPANLGFLSIPGNVDIAIRNDYLYADNGPDLITIDLKDVQSARVTSRQEEVFANYIPFTDQGYILYYEPTDQTVEMPCTEAPGGGFFWSQDVLMLESAFAKDGAVFASNVGAVPSAVGTGGSLARFTILDQHLYTVDQSSLHVFSLQNPSAPSEGSLVNIGWGIETIFPLGDNLFIGANDGMYIFDATDRNAPVQLSVFQHARACDPVFVDGNLAYVTLRDGTMCESFTNQLDVVDVTDLTNPKLLRTFPMHRPIGLSVVRDRLYLCEDDLGLKVFDVADWSNIGDGPVEHLTGFRAVDIIALPGRNLAMVIGDQGLYQFDISNPDRPEQRSIIPVVQP